MPAHSPSHFDFDPIAQRYDRCNHLFSLGIDRIWRRALARRMECTAGQTVIDLCCGSGDMVFSVCRHTDAGKITGVDCSPAMLDRARQKQTRLASKRWVKSHTIEWLQEDAAALSSPSNSATAITCAFGVRNVTDRAGLLSQVERVLEVGGDFWVLEFSLPANRMLRAFFRFYVGWFMPLLSRPWWGRGPLRYLADSITHWHTQVPFAAEIEAAGLTLVERIPLTFGAVTLWHIQKPR